MRIKRDGKRIRIWDQPAPFWALGLFLLTGGLVAVAMPLGLATNAKNLEPWERLASILVGSRREYRSLVVAGAEPGLSGAARSYTSPTTDGEVGDIWAAWCGSSPSTISPTSKWRRDPMTRVASYGAPPSGCGAESWSYCRSCGVTTRRG